MANVIPEDMRSAAWSRSRARFILAASIVALVGAGISLLMLLPAYFVFTTKTAGVTPLSAPLSQADITNDNNAVLQTKGLLAELSPMAATSSTATDAILTALSVLPAGVHVDQITYAAGAPSSLMLVGSADTTNGISAYKNALAGIPLFTAVSVPVAALVGTDGGRFSITLSGTF